MNLIAPVQHYHCAGAVSFFWGVKCVLCSKSILLPNCKYLCDKIGKDNQILLSAKVVDELDKLKITLGEESKQNVEKALRNINRALDASNVSFEVANTNLLPIDFNPRSPDNLILSVALKYKDDNPVLLTSDNGLQIKCKGLGISTISLKEFIKR